jgi:UTP--glucose-1-phosphate uridylyltransferase
VKVIIPAAGLGTRFAKEGLGVPKELLPLGGRPVLGHALDEAARANFDAAVVVISPTKPQIRHFLADTNLPLPVEIVVQPEARGIGDAVLMCWDATPVAVLLPDDVVRATEHWTALLDIHHESGGAALCVRRVPIETTSRFGIAECEGTRVTRLLEKPPPGTSSSDLAIFGRYIVTETVTTGLRNLDTVGERELTSGFATAIQSPAGVCAIYFEAEIYDCGTPAEYARSLARYRA